MREDISLFKYELAVAAIVKDEAPYIKEWLDYHVMAGVDHFYVFDNDSSDELKAVLEPYIDAEVVEYAPIAGKCAQILVYNEVVEKHKFDCRYIAFIDADEFIQPRGDKTIKDVLHEVLNDDSEAVGLTINWHMFGSGGQDNADLEIGVLERFLYRTPDDFGSDKNEGNAHVKTIANPRGVELITIPHFAMYFNGMTAVDENGKVVLGAVNAAVPDKKIVINHYYTKSKEEFIKKMERGRADTAYITGKMEDFNSTNAAGTVFDDSILEYRQRRFEAIADDEGNAVFNFETLDEIDARRLNAVVRNLMPATLQAVPDEFFLGKVDRFLTCRAVSHALTESNVDRATAKYFEELSLRCVYRSLASGDVPVWQVLLLLEELPNLLALEYEVIDGIKNACRQLLPQLMNLHRLHSSWEKHAKYKYILKMLEGIS